MHCFVYPAPCSAWNFGAFRSDRLFFVTHYIEDPRLIFCKCLQNIQNYMTRDTDVTNRHTDDLPQYNRAMRSIAR